MWNGRRANRNKFKVQVSNTSVNPPASNSTVSSVPANVSVNGQVNVPTIIKNKELKLENYQKKHRAILCNLADADNQESILNNLNINDGQVYGISIDNERKFAFIFFVDLDVAINCVKDNDSKYNICLQKSYSKHKYTVNKTPNSMEIQNIWNLFSNTNNMMDDNRIVAMNISMDFKYWAISTVSVIPEEICENNDLILIDLNTTVIKLIIPQTSPDLLDSNITDQFTKIWGIKSIESHRDHGKLYIKVNNHDLVRDTTIITKSLSVSNYRLVNESFFYIRSSIAKIKDRYLHGRLEDLENQSIKHEIELEQHAIKMDENEEEVDRLNNGLEDTQNNIEEVELKLGNLTENLDNKFKTIEYNFTKQIEAMQNEIKTTSTNVASILSILKNQQ